MGVFDEDAISHGKSAKSPQDFNSDVEGDFYDDLEDANENEVDFVIEMHREDGIMTGSALSYKLANDLEEFIVQLSRLPGEAGVVGMICIAAEFFVIVRVRGKIIQVLLSDAGAANDWPIARDVIEYLGIEVPDPDDDPAPIGDLNIFNDNGIDEITMEMMMSDYDEDADVILTQIIRKIGYEAQFKKILHVYGV